MQFQNIDITNNNNKLVIEFDGDKKEIEIEPKNYSIDELIEELNDAFIDLGVSIHTSIYENEYIIFYSYNYKHFSFKNEENQLTRLLGFTEGYYGSDIIHQSENKYSVV